MTMTTCKECEHSVSTAARACPSCGVPSPGVPPLTPDERAAQFRIQWIYGPVGLLIVSAVSILVSSGRITA